MYSPFSVFVFAEPIIVEVMFRNPLKVSLVLSNLSLIWNFTLDGVPPLKEKMPDKLTISNEETLARGVGNLCILS